MTWDGCWPLAADLFAQAGISTEARVGGALPARAARTGQRRVPANTDLVLDGDQPVLKRRKVANRLLSAIMLEAAIHQRLPERSPVAPICDPHRRRSFR